MIRIKCPACTSTDKLFKYTANGYKIIKCSKCYSLFVENVPELDELLKQYKMMNDLVKSSSSLEGLEQGKIDQKTLQKMAKKFKGKIKI